MRVCDYIANKVYEMGMKEVFLVTGGGNMFLTDGIASHPDLKGIPCHHEQAVAMAVVGYAKYSGFGAGFVTTGCGGTNTITGVLQAYQDSTPCIFFSGQCATNEIIASSPSPLRQFGMQEADIVSIVRPITKYAITLMDSNMAVYEIEKAISIAKSGHPGPVWIDVPADVQQAEIDIDKVPHYSDDTYDVIKCSDEDIDALKQMFSEAKRPVIIAGHGIRLAGAMNEFKDFIEEYSIPFVFTRLGFDAYPTGWDLNAGPIGIRGNRSGNFTIQNADLVVSIGSRLSKCATGYNNELFAREAKVVVVDVDADEHKKNTIHIDKFIYSDAKYFLSRVSIEKKEEYVNWANKVKHWKAKYPVCLPEFYDDTDGISMYAFTNELNKCMKDDDAVITDAGSTFYVVPQTLQFTSLKQRYVMSSAQAEMGFTVPGSIGVCFAKGKTNTIGIVGDGSLQMNIQELQTIKYNKLPIKLFVWNNGGYLSIRGAQKNRFNGRYLGSSEESGTSLPDLRKISDAYGIKYIRISHIADAEEIIKEVVDATEPVICEVMCKYEEWILCTWSKQTFPDGHTIPMPIEDMVPLLPRDEFYNEMIVKPVS